MTITNATNPALAINSNGTVGFLYQQVTGQSGSQRWETHLRQTSDGAVWDDLLLATVPEGTPPPQFQPYLGDYIYLTALGTDFYGIFCANNTPDLGNFPQGVVNQRNANFTTHTLLAVDGTTPVAISIDPFFFSLIQRLYQVHGDGTIWVYTGTPLTGWQMLDNNPATTAIAASGANLYQLHGDGTIWVYTGIPLTGWQMLDNNPRARAIVLAQ